MIQVFGHKAPDTDSTGSPLIWAWYLTEVRKTPAKAVLQGSPNTEAVWMLGRWGVDMPEFITDVAPGDQCVIVDTNNLAELPASINEAEVMEVIDHHLLAGGLKTRLPINITIRPLACTATIMHDLIGADLDRAPAWVKGLMLTCILSDTLEFRSPTTTPHDRFVAENLARVMPRGLVARLDRGRWPVPAVFGTIAHHGRVEQSEMERTFNMGVGMVAVVAPEDTDRAQAVLTCRPVRDQLFRRRAAPCAFYAVV